MRKEGRDRTHGMFYVQRFQSPLSCFVPHSGVPCAWPGNNKPQCCPRGCCLHQALSSNLSGYSRSNPCSLPALSHMFNILRQGHPYHLPHFWCTQLSSAHPCHKPRLVIFAASAQMVYFLLLPGYALMDKPLKILLCESLPLLSHPLVSQVAPQKQIHRGIDWCTQMHGFSAHISLAGLGKRANKAHASYLAPLSVFWHIQPHSTHQLALLPRSVLEQARPILLVCLQRWFYSNIEPACLSIWRVGMGLEATQPSMDSGKRLQQITKLSSYLSTELWLWPQHGYLQHFKPESPEGQCL